MGKSNQSRKEKKVPAVRNSSVKEETKVPAKVLVRNSSTEEVDEQLGRKTQWSGKGKEGNGSKKLKLRDFPRASQRILQKARKLMAVKLVTKNAFPSNETRILWASDCYNLACDDEFEGFLSACAVLSFMI